MGTILNPVEIRVVACLEKFFVEHGNPQAMGDDALESRTIISECGLTKEEYRRIIFRFVSLGWVTIMGEGARDEWVKIDEEICSVKREIDDYKPPVPNYWEQFKTWAFSKWWIVPVMILGVAVPWCVGIVVGLQLLLKWFGVTK